MATSEPTVRALLTNICRTCCRPARSVRPVRPAARQIATAATAKTATAATARRATAVGAASAARRLSSRSEVWTRPQESRRLGLQKRTLSAGTKESAVPKGPAESTEAAERILEEDDLFHSFTNSPIADMRRRAAYIKMHALCPHPHHQHGPTDGGEPLPNHQLKTLERLEGGSMAAAHVDFECPDCGVPVYCSEQHWMDDYEAHLQICDTLRQINEDDHDLRSGRAFPEFDYPGEQMEEALVNMTNWDTLMYTRGFSAVNDDRSMRQVTRLLTYPLTVASVLHELSPYNIRKGGRMTAEGLKSFSALRYTLHPPLMGESDSVKGIRPQAPAVRLFVLGARAESSLPREVWVQLAHLFPRARIHVILIGPESMTNRDDEFPLPERTAANPFGAVVEDRIWPTMKVSTIVDYFHNIYQTGYFYPYDPYFDCFMLFHPGLGHPASSHEWAQTVPMLLETKAPVLVTGYTQYDMERDIAWVNRTAGGEFDLLLEPGENIFRSLRWDLNDLDPQDISCGNWGLWAFRGKRYEATRKTE